MNKCQCPYCSEENRYPRLVAAILLITTCKSCKRIIAVVTDDNGKKSVAIAFDPSKAGSLTLDKQKYIRSIALGEDSEVNLNSLDPEFIEYVDGLTPPISEEESKAFARQLDDPNLFDNF